MLQFQSQHTSIKATKILNASDLYALLKSQQDSGDSLEGIELPEGLSKQPFNDLRISKINVEILLDAGVPLKNLPHDNLEHVTLKRIAQINHANFHGIDISQCRFAGGRVNSQGEVKALLRAGITHGYIELAPSLLKECERDWLPIVKTSAVSANQYWHMVKPAFKNCLPLTDKIKAPMAIRDYDNASLIEWRDWLLLMSNMPCLEPSVKARIQADLACANRSLSWVLNKENLLTVCQGKTCQHLKHAEYNTLIDFVKQLPAGVLSEDNVEILFQLACKRHQHREMRPQGNDEVLDNLFYTLGWYLARAGLPVEEMLPMSFDAIGPMERTYAEVPLDDLIILSKEDGNAPCAYDINEILARLEVAEVLQDPATNMPFNDKACEVICLSTPKMLSQLEALRKRIVDREIEVLKHCRQLSQETHNKLEALAKNIRACSGAAFNEKQALGYLDDFSEYLSGREVDRALLERTYVRLEYRDEPTNYNMLVYLATSGGCTQVLGDTMIEYCGKVISAMNLVVLEINVKRESLKTTVDPYIEIIKSSKMKSSNLARLNLFPQPYEAKHDMHHSARLVAHYEKQHFGNKQSNF